MNIRVVFRNTMAVVSAAAVSMASIPAIHAQDAPLRTGDSIDVRIGGVPASEIAMVSGSYVVDNNGQINLSYIGKVSIVGKTAAQAADLVESTYKSQEIYSNPTITISTQNAAPRFVNVGGEVKSVSNVPYRTDLTFMTAINAAGGFTEFANRKKVRLIRGKDVKIIDYTQMMKNPALDFPVLPGDQIYVEQSWL